MVPTADLRFLIDDPSYNLRAVEHVLSRSHSNTHAGLQDRETRQMGGEVSQGSKQCGIAREAKSEEFLSHMPALLVR